MVVVGMLTRRVPAIAAKLALIGGVAAIAIAYFVPPVKEALSELNNFHFLGIVFASLVAMMLLIGRICPQAEPWQHQHSGDVDLTPWRYAKPMAAGLVILVLSLYTAFADFSILSEPKLPEKPAASVTEVENLVDAE